MTAYVHTCRPPGVPASARVERRRDRPFTVDVHCHLMSPKAEALVADAPQKRAEPQVALASQGEASVRRNVELMREAYLPRLTRLEDRLADMDAMGVDVQALSPAPTQYYYWAAPDLADAIASASNAAIAEACALHPDRFVGLANVSLQHPDLAARQLEHAVRELGFKGAEVSTLVEGADIADRRFDPFWAKAEELGAVVFIHPLGTTLGPRLDAHYLANIVGQPLETAVCLSKLIFDGALDRHPGLKIIAAHGGGYLPLYAGRSDHGWRVRPEACGCALPPSDYLRRIFFDTVVYEPAHLRRLADEVGVGRLLLGTDYPYDMGDYDPHGLVDAVPGLSQDEKAALLGGNARALLGLEVTA